MKSNLLFITSLAIVLTACSRTTSTQPEATTPTSAPSPDLAQSCTDAGGTFVAEFNECEYVSLEVCQGLGGTFNECGSACRHQPQPAMCTQQCVPFCAFDSDQSGLSQSIPQSVTVDAGAPLTCDLLDQPKQIENLTATYGCQAPGAYLESVDTSTEPWTAQYFTTNSQGDQVTFGPEIYPAAPNE